MLDDISAGGKKIWYSAVVELKTHEEVLSGKLSTNDATLLKIEGSEHSWQRRFSSLLDELCDDLELRGADIVNLNRLYYLVPLGATSQRLFEEAVKSESAKAYVIQPGEAEALTNSYLSLALRLQADHHAAYVKTRRQLRRLHTCK